MVLATVPLGIARAAIDDLLELAVRKTPSYLATPLRDRSNIQALIGEAEAALGAGRAYLYEALGEVWDKALQGHVIDMPGKMKLQLAATYAAAAAAKVVDLVHAAAGTTSIRDEHRFQRHFRDAHTITQHAFISASRYEFGGPVFSRCADRMAVLRAVATRRLARRLRAADASIIPTIPRANTHLTCVMIGERVAEWMLVEAD